MALLVEVSSIRKLVALALDGVRGGPCRAVLIAAFVTLGCSETAGSVPPADEPLQQSQVSPADLAALVGAPVLVGAGDIAGCDSRGDEATAKLLDSIPGVVFTAGDNAYPSGSRDQFARCYGSSWGRHLARTYPAMGNHDFENARGGPYYDYFGARAGTRNLGYYAYRVGEWLVLTLNSEIEIGIGSQQLRWVATQLELRDNDCELVIMHRPRFSSGPHGGSRRTIPLWNMLYEHGADVVVAGHDHLYERFAPQTPTGRKDLQRGIREFVVGTGGIGHYAVPGSRVRNSETINNRTFGVLKLRLGSGVYAWEFVPVAGGRFRDQGIGRCH